MSAPLQVPASIEYGWLVFGLQLGLEGTLTEGLLLATAVVWIAAGAFALAHLGQADRRRRFWGYFLLTCVGNIGLIVARDVVGFYCFYSLMTFAAYGLVAHAQSESARRAGRVYLVMAVLAEMLLLAAFLVIVGAGINARLADVPRVVAESTRPGWLSGLLVVGFGVKAGAFLLHLWLPLAHPVAPTSASAVLSGAMIKAGLLGWLSFLPLGLIALPALGATLVVGGLGAAFLAALAGVTQEEPKTILAYSSVSQMGFLTTLVGLGLAHPEAQSTVVAAALVFAMHHALVKAALFLGTGVAYATSAPWPARLVTLGLAVAAYNLAGAPFSSGALAKASLERVAGASPRGELLSWFFSCAAVGSTLLMVRFLLRVAPTPAPDGRAPSAGLWLPWAVLVLLPVGLVAAPPGGADVAKLFRGSGIWASAWPPLAGLAIAGLTRAGVTRGWALALALARCRVPPGDLLIVLERLWGALRRGALALRSALQVDSRRTNALVARVTRLFQHALESAASAEPRLGGFAAIGSMLFVLLLIVLGLSLVPNGAERPHPAGARDQPLEMNSRR